MRKKLTLLTAMVGLATLLLLPAAGTLGKGPGPTPAPAGEGRIAVNVQGNYYLVNPDGSRPTFLVAADEQAGQKFHTSYTTPAWSPMFADGSAKISYHHYDSASATYSMRIIDGYPTPAAGTQPHVLFEDPNGGFNRMGWSPAEPEAADGTQKVRVAFTRVLDRGLPSERAGIKILNVIYNNTTRSFSLDSERVDVMVDPGVTDANYVSPRFSPDGQWLAVEWYGPILATGYRHHAVWLVKADGSVQVPLVDETGADDFDPAWWWPAPGYDDGCYHVAFISTRTGRYEVFAASFRLDTDGTVTYLDVQRVNSGSNVTERYPTWSPFGTQIAYHTAGKPNVGQIGKVTSIDGQQYNVTSGMWPAWAPPGVPNLP